jgi:hypothetical protein
MAPIGQNSPVPISLRSATLHGVKIVYVEGDRVQIWIPYSERQCESRASKTLAWLTGRWGQNAETN